MFRMKTWELYHNLFLVSVFNSKNEMMIYIIPAQNSYTKQTFIDGSIMNIADAPWPGLTPDLLSVFLVVACKSMWGVC
jgi:hypothetical protein